MKKLRKLLRHASDEKLEKLMWDAQKAKRQPNMRDPYKRDFQHRPKASQ